MQTYKLILITMFFNFFSFGQTNLKDFRVIYSKVNPISIDKMDVVFLEPSLYNKNDITTIKQKVTKVYGYLSLTEVNKENTHLFKPLLPYLLKDNEVWGSSYIDVSKPEVLEIFKKELEFIFNKGFDGVLLDNADNVTEFGVYPSLELNLVEMIGRIKESFPEGDFIINGGVELLKYIHPFIEGVLMESVFTDYHFNSKTYHLRSEPEAKQRLIKLKKGLKKYKKQGFVVEYAVDTTMINEVNRLCKKEKLACMVGNIKLED